MPDNDWATFADRLGHSLEAMDAEQFLIVVVPERHRFVQFSTQGARGLRGECVSNQYVKADERLSRKDEQALARLGWLAPDLKALGTGAVGENPAGSTNWYRDFERPIDCRAAAELAAKTLAEVYAVPNPGSLKYKAFDATGASVLLPELGLEREGPVGSPRLPEQPSLEQRVIDAAAYAADGTVERVGDGSWALAIGGAPLVITVPDGGTIARIIIPLFRTDGLSARLDSAVNIANAELVEFGYVYRRDTDVRYAAEVIVNPFEAAAIPVGLELAAANARLALDFLGSDGFRVE